MDNIIECRLNSTCKEIFTGLWQYDYGQILRITGVEFPKAVEIQFSLNEKSGSTITRIGTTVDGVTEVQIPDELLKNEGHSQDYSIYAYIYLTDETSGNTEYQIVLHVKSRTKPENPSEEPLPEPNIFHETIVAVNASAERAETAEKKAKASATEASKYASSASDSAVIAEKTKEVALKEVGEKKQEAIEAIQNQEEISVRKIATHTDDEIQRIKNQIAESKGELEQTITNAGVSKEELNKSIETASDTKTALDKSVEMAGTAKTELNMSIREAGTAKNALDESIEIAGTVQETLSATVKQAGALDTSLGEKIETGTQLKTDIVASGEKAVKDIQTAGSEQLGKMQAVAEEFTADREQITTNKEDIGSLKEDLSNKITKFYASNQGETHLADSDSGKIQDMVLYGKSKQERTTGAQLFPTITPSIEEKNGITVEHMEHGKIHISGTAEKTVGFTTPTFELLAGTYTLSMGVNIDNTLMRCTLSTAEGLPYFDILNNEASKVETTEDNMILYLLLRVYGGKTIDITIQPMLNTGTSPLPWEPYTGGQPSPSPDYPQEIKSVVNPTIKLLGSNILKMMDDKYQIDGLTVTVSNGVVKLKGTSNRYLDIKITANSKIVFKEGTQIIFSPNNVKSMGESTNCYLDFTNNNTKGFSISNHNTNTPYIIQKSDSEYDFNLWIRCQEGTYDETWKPQILIGETITTFKPYIEQTLTLPITLNAIPVTSGGNVTIDGQQWVCDEVDLERGVKVQRVNRLKLDELSWKHELTQINKNDSFISDVPASQDGTMRGDSLCQYAVFSGVNYDTEMTESSRCYVWTKVATIQFKAGSGVNSFDAFSEWLKAHPDASISYCLAVPIETTLTNDEIAVFNAFTTYYPVTNISVNSEQLDGYTVFNYPISLANGWNYVKQQLGDTRDYIYDMDAKAQDIDIQSAEAYVNSEYAVALTELEVM